MQRFLILVCSTLLFLSCTTNAVEMIEIAEINSYPTSSLNQTLGKDLLFYDYQLALLKEIPEVTPEGLRYIFWDVFTRTSDNKIFFRLKLNTVNSLVRNNKGKITSYFQKEYAKNLKNHINNENDFVQAIKIGEQYLNYIDTDEFAAFIEKCSDQFISTTNPKDFEIMLGKRNESLGKAISRLVFSKQYYAHLEDVRGKFYVLQFLTKFPENPTVNEIIILEKMINNDWKIAGYKIN